jgi:dCTP deaminase
MEILNIPNGIVGILVGRSSVGRLGIQVEQGGFIDSGYKGPVTFTIHNQTRMIISLYAKMRIAQIYFIRSEYADKVYGALRSSKYLNTDGPSESMLYKDLEWSNMNSR